jgi:hypothetical protein
MLPASRASALARAPAKAEAFARIRTCGCFGLPRRKCDRCAAGHQGDGTFVACSLACLRRHLKTAHQVTQSTLERVAESAAPTSGRRGKPGQKWRHGIQVIDAIVVRVVV